MTKAVIFDMYETLITHFESPLYFGKQITADLGLDERKFREIWDGTDDARTLGETTFDAVIERIMRLNGIYSEELLRSISAKRTAAKVECFRHLHPEIVPMLTELKRRGIKIGLITNCFSEESRVIRESALFPFFDEVCMSCEVALKKPDERIFRLCMEKLGVSHNECLYVGDGGSGELEAAVSCGMRAVQAVWYLKDGEPRQQKRKNGFTHINSPLDLINELK